MAIRSRNKRQISFNATSMSDLVFLLLIFFMITSTLISPNAIKLLLPSSNSKTMAKRSVTVYINSKHQYLMDVDNTGNPIVVNRTLLLDGIKQQLAGQVDGSVVLRSDKTVPVQYVVNVIDVVNEINDGMNTKHKVILATKPDR